jgi:hypothetical protein
MVSDKNGPRESLRIGCTGKADVSLSGITCIVVAILPGYTTDLFMEMPPEAKFLEHFFCSSGITMVFVFMCRYGL